eukprot:TRINITY_DN2544_c0_g1_i1.p1 TRINITY_DN2544_c0_g1~~TRINITY_DN2544_c0_g1_i1.p1  ORF type:complete len:307 (-),score=92.80 TRINITY_DN2544_c0_g1_i1:45-965(-)
MGKDYYAILEIVKTADDETIKKGYKRLALRWHPDRNLGNKDQAEAKFKEIAEAYEILIDKEKRRIYDASGEDGLKGNPQFGRNGFHFNTRNPEDIFAQFFGQYTNFNFANTGFAHKPATPQQSPPLTKTFTCSLEELYKGCTKKMKIKKEIVDADNTNQKIIEKVLTIRIQKGWKSGTKITFEREGDEKPGIIPADIIFVLEEKKHPLFTRDKDDLHYSANITLLEALVGFSIRIKTLDDRDLTITPKEIIKSGFTQIVENEGMPLQKNPNKKGNLIVTYNVLYPKEFNDKQKELLKTAFEDVSFD